MSRFEVGKPLSKELSRQYHDEALLLNQFLSALNTVNSALSYIAISDLSDELGLEIFSSHGKIAEVYCVELRNGALTGKLQVHGKKNWRDANILCINEACTYVAS